MRILLPFLILVVFLLPGCRVIQFSAAEKVKAAEACIQIKLEGNQAIIPVEIEGRPQKLALDMGAGGSVLFDTAVIPGYSARKKAYFGAVKGADRRKMKVARMPLQMSNSLHTSTNKVFLILPKSPVGQTANCATTAGYTGLYGYDLMQLSETGYLLDFKGGQICNLKPAELPQLLTQGYQQVKAKISDRYIIIYIMINGVEYPFKFDTGYTGSFTMPYKKEIGFLEDEHVAMEGIQAMTVSGFVSGEDKYYQKQVGFGGQDYATTITVSRSIKAQNVGMGFIKAFNWLVDTKNNKLYIKKNGIEQDTKLRQIHLYYAQASGGKLLVRLRRTGSNGYGIGEEITSVNGESVSAQNICVLLKKLNESEDWNALKVVTKKP